MKLTHSCKQGQVAMGEGGSSYLAKKQGQISISNFKQTKEERKKEESVCQVKVICSSQQKQQQQGIRWLSSQEDLCLQPNFLRASILAKRGRISDGKSSLSWNNMIGVIFLAASLSSQLKTKTYQKRERKKKKTNSLSLLAHLLGFLHFFPSLAIIQREEDFFLLFFPSSIFPHL